jgi:ABC-type nitrate/sulfonate/bicarbonate transport system substrate-binding protein
MKKLRLPVLLVLLALLVAACGGADDSPTGQPSPTAAQPTDAETGAPTDAAEPTGPGEPETDTVRVAFASQPDFTQIMNFKWLDDMEAAGLTVEDNYFESSQDAFRALVAGEADVAVGTLLSAILLVQESGEGVKVIASDLQAPDYLLISQQSVESLEDLEGGRVGISTPGDISDTLTRVLLDREGIDVDAVNFVQIGGTGARMSALLEGQIEAGAAHAAEGLTAAEEGLKNLFAYGNSIPDYLQHGLIVTDDWIADNPNLTQLMVDLFVDSTRWAAENKDEYIELSAETVEGPSDAARDEAYEIFQEIDMFAVNGGMTDELLQNTVDIEKEVGTLDDSAPPIEEWADASFVEDYLERNGEQ